MRSTVITQLDRNKSLYPLRKAFSRLSVIGFDTIPGIVPPKA
ncbi:18660_t:CDS:2 [Funneliformis geosporum]|uniref:14325_t:CDS:1 n=1 Tax=Funneliformis geosporum TaxID=1117311 RepID=A0A9W4WV64_9GLOM|nr:14325_t:CDS:2 [Funneliformis geosporum]CAI2184014.1 18660_t:CDS:2 [Funneliformis geosporum]